MGVVWASARASSALIALLAISTPARFAVGSNAQISGTYWATEYHAKIAVGGGGDLPLTAAGDV